MRTLMRSSADVSARKTYDLIDEPVGGDYRSLLDVALPHCDSAVLGVDAQPSPEATAALALLEPFATQPPSAGGGIRRFRFSRESVPVLKQLAGGLYDWRGPDLPSDLCLLRSDGTPWMVSVAAQRLGYIELAPFERLLLTRTAPGLAAVMAHQGAKDAVLAVFERSFESRVEALSHDMRTYAGAVVDESREGLVDALRDWLESDEQARMTVAVELAAALRLDELRDDIAEIRDSLAADPELAPAVYSHNAVLRDRWRARFLRQLQEALRGFDG
ncbi:MAG: hypothetical protein NVSMB29_02680 [Candidatus Dormibacteria bacterium]